ncbi:MAG: N-6 DNA methylase, partial [Ilumatobacteraceae bacterium]
MDSASPAVSERKRLGAWYTPPDLVDLIVGEVVAPSFVRSVGDRPLRVLDPACGDGRFLRAVAERVSSLGADCRLVGVDVDRAAADRARREVDDAHVVVADALSRDWDGERFDLVIGNPPFLSQMAAATSRGGSSDLGGGPYADAAAEFLALASQLVEPDGGRVAFVLPQSILAARDAAEVRARYDERSEMVWSWWSDERVFDAGVFTCALAFEFDPTRTAPAGATWSHVVASRRSVPPLP